MSNRIDGIYTVNRRKFKTTKIYIEVCLNKKDISIWECNAGENPTKCKEIIEEDKIEVSEEALKELLTAIMGPPHYIRELLAIMNLPDSKNCLKTLIDEYNDSITKTVDTKG